MEIKSVMKIKSTYVSMTLLAACTLLQACGGSNHSSNTPPPPASQTPVTLDTPRLLLSTQVTSETDEPITVNDGLVTVAGADDETSDPAAAP